MAARGTGAEAAPIRVYLEAGRRSTFAVALDWPGWCRRRKTPESALSELEAYRTRYATAVGGVPQECPPEVISTIDGTGTTDFGAPDARGPWDDDPPTGDELVRQVGLLEEAWAYFDRVVASAPVELRKGPRGGGRDRDAIVSHVMEAERVYGRKVGTRVAPRTSCVASPGTSSTTRGRSRTRATEAGAGGLSLPWSRTAP